MKTLAFFSVLFFFFFILTFFFFLGTECVNVFKYLEGRFINIVFIKLASDLNLIDFQ